MHNASEAAGLAREQQLHEQMKKVQKDAAAAKEELTRLSTTLTAEISCKTTSADIVSSASASGDALTPAMLMMGATPRAAATEFDEAAAPPGESDEPQRPAPIAPHFDEQPEFPRSPGEEVPCNVRNRPNGM